MNKKQEKNNLKESYRQDNGKYKCPYCDKEYSFKGINYHIKTIHLNPDILKLRVRDYSYTEGRIVWNKGKSKLTDERVKKNGESYSKAYKEGKIVIWCKGKTKETDIRIKNMSNKVSNTVLNKIENDEWHLSFSHSRTHNYKGLKLHGSWELKYAEYLDKNNIKWIRPKDKFKYIFENKIRNYSPDFYLIDSDEYIEIKGYPTDKDIAKWKQFNLKLKIISGKDLYELGLIDSYKKCFDKIFEDYKLCI